MPGQSTIWGQESDYYFGPGALYANTSVGFVAPRRDGTATTWTAPGYASVSSTGTGTYLGKTGPMEFKISAMYAEAVSIQTGAAADDFAVSGQSVSIATALKEASKTRLALTMDGFSHENDSANADGQYGYVSVIGKRGRANAVRCTYVAIEDGVEQWAKPECVVDLFICIFRTPEATVAIDAETFREVPIQMDVVASQDDLDYAGRMAFFLSRAEQ